LSTTNEKCKVTVGVTCYNNGDNIGHLITDLQCQVFKTGGGAMEIIVIASGCTDNTISEVRERSTRDKRIRLIVEQHRNGKPTAINKILQAMTGDILVLVSGDIRLSNEHFIENILSHFSSGADVVGCRPLPANGTDTTEGYIGRLIWNLHDRTLMAQVENELKKQAGEAFAIRREVAEEIPPDVINDDAYLVLKAQLAGGRFVYAREITVWNRTPDKVQDILMQRARIIRGHKQLRHSIGTSPSALDVLIFKQPLIVADVLIQEIKEQIAERRLRILCFLQLIALELAAHLLSGMWNFSHLWPTAESAKWDKEAA
jgi:cellulose synthase/poly-beta-1,6-N-acetylglucosamine synthase-like glycosyltransferase